MYEPYYGLSAKPFKLSPDADFFYSSKSHDRAAGFLEYGLSQAEGFVVITGETGTGKTILARNFFGQLALDKYLVVHIMHTRFQPNETLSMVAAAFGLPCEKSTQAELLIRIEHFLLSIKRQRVILVVDEAQNLSPDALETLRMLTNFQVGEQSFLQIFLIGQAQLGKTLLNAELEALRLRVTASCHLNRMDMNDTQEYIEHRLKTVHWQGDPTFSAQAYLAIFQNTDGNPQKINRLCDRILLMGFLEELHAIDTTEVGKVIGDMLQEAALPDMAEEKYASTDTPSWMGNEAENSLNARLSRIEHSVSAIEHMLSHNLP